MATYICKIWSNSSYGREYTVKTKSAMKCAADYGHAEGGEVVQVERKNGTVISRVEWSAEHRDYIRVTVVR